MIWFRLRLLSLMTAACFMAQLFDASAAQFFREQTEFEGDAPSFQADDVTSAPPFVDNDFELRTVRKTANLVFLDSESVHSLKRIDLSHDQSITISGAPGETVRLDLGDFVLTGHSAITLQGTATTRFIINVRDQFSLAQSSWVTLSGGLQWNNAVFRIMGNGSAVRLRKRATFEGTLIANRRRVILSGRSIVFGKIVTRRLRITDLAHVIQPPVVSP
jgi:hypothetical protein